MPAASAQTTASGSSGTAYSRTTGRAIRRQGGINMVCAELCGSIANPATFVCYVLGRTAPASCSRVGVAGSNSARPRSAQPGLHLSRHRMALDCPSPLLSPQACSPRLWRASSKPCKYCMTTTTASQGRPWPPVWAASATRCWLLTTRRQQFKRASPRGSIPGCQHIISLTVPHPTRLQVPDSRGSGGRHDGSGQR